MNNPEKVSYKWNESVVPSVLFCCPFGSKGIFYVLVLGSLVSGSGFREVTKTIHLLPKVNV